MSSSLEICFNPLNKSALELHIFDSQLGQILSSLNSMIRFKFIIYHYAVIFNICMKFSFTAPIFKSLWYSTFHFLANIGSPMLSFYALTVSTCQNSLKEAYECTDCRVALTKDARCRSSAAEMSFLQSST